MRDETSRKVHIGGTWLVVLDLISQERLHKLCTCTAPRRRRVTTPLCTYTVAAAHTGHGGSNCNSCVVHCIEHSIRGAVTLDSRMAWSGPLFIISL